MDIATHPRRYVSLRVAAAWLAVDEKTLRKYIASGLLSTVQFGARRKLALGEIRAFEARAAVPRETGNSGKGGNVAGDASIL